MAYEIKKITTSYNYGKWHCVLDNPFVGIYYTKVIYGGSYEIVEKKVLKQLKAWEKSKDEDISRIEENKKNHENMMKEYDENNLYDIPF